MLGGMESAGIERLRAALAQRGIVLPEAEVAVGAAQVGVVQRALQRLNEHDVVGLEPTAYVHGQDEESSQ